MQTILITGTEGFIGSKLVKKLEGKDISFILPTTAERVDWHIKEDNIRPETIIHCGAISDSRYDNPDIFEYNTESTRRLAEYARDQYANLIFLSSQAAYNPVNFYGYSKLYAEQYIARLVRNHCILRLPNVYGDENTEKQNPSIVAKIMNKNLPFLLRGCQRRFIHVDDVVGLILDLVRKKVGTFKMGTFNVDAPEVSIEDLVLKVGYENHKASEYYYNDGMKGAICPIVDEKEGAPVRILRDDNLPLLKPPTQTDVMEYVKGE